MLFQLYTFNHNILNEITIIKIITKTMCLKCPQTLNGKYVPIVRNQDVVDVVLQRAAHHVKLYKLKHIYAVVPAINWNKEHYDSNINSRNY